MGMLTDAGRAAMLKAIKDQSIYLGLGTGESNWGDSPPTETPEATALKNEVGRRVLTRALFVTPSDSGTIEVPLTQGSTGEVTTQKYALSESPTRHLYLEFALDFADAAGQTIRELGVFIGCVKNASVASDKKFLTPSEFSDPGLLFQLEHREPIVRKIDTRDTISWVISI